MKVAVIVGRFQLPSLHVEHQRLLRTAYEKADKVLVFIGTRVVRSERDPLPFHLVKDVVKSTQSASMEIHEMQDCKTDQQWINSLQDKVSKLTSPEDEVFYYGSRDSFLDTLPEGSNIVRMVSETTVSATEVRGKINYKNSIEFREGYIKAVQDEYKGHFSVVDAIITDGKNVLLGKKKSGYCLIGGFPDDSDKDLESAVLREVEEETGLKLSSPVYFTSKICQDWRYSRTRQPFTTVYELKVDSFEGAKAADDILEVKVVPLKEVENYFSPESFHLKILKQYRECQQ